MMVNYPLGLEVNKMLFIDVLMKGLGAFPKDGLNNIMLYDINSTGWFTLLAVFLSIFFSLEVILFLFKAFPTDDEGFSFMIVNFVNFAVSFFMTLLGMKVWLVLLIILLSIAAFIFVKIGIWKLYKL